MIRRILTFLDPAGYRTAYAHERRERQRVEVELERALKNCMSLLDKLQSVSKQREELLRENERLRMQQGFMSRFVQGGVS